MTTWFKIREIHSIFGSVLEERNSDFMGSN